MVSPTFAIELLKNALDIYTPSRSESQLANFLKDICMDMGFEQANIDSVGNMLAVPRKWRSHYLVMWSYGYCSWNSTC